MQTMRSTRLILQSPSSNCRPLTCPAARVMFLDNHSPTFYTIRRHLQFLDLSHDSFRGGFPSWLLENNTNLAQLILANSSLSGILLLPNQSHLLTNSLGHLKQCH
ncbi:unnamed protein product [Linum trigynum]|uniref:Uncharacterized protein n=1 Tax=Linum trigynum TaxID=586398 RepID=A0AAV2CN51_9ROSI